MSDPRRRRAREQRPAGLLAEGGFAMTDQILLNGCAPEPLIHYLKALGVFRLVSEQCDPQARGAWMGDVFALETVKTADELVGFFLNEYRPTPIVAPWNNGSGFHAKEDAKEGGKKVAAFRGIKTSTSKRFQAYRETIITTEELLASCMTEKIAALESTKRSEALKPLLVPLCRNNLPDEIVRWIDAVCLMTDENGLKFPPLLGSAGNDGNLEFSLTFMGRLQEILPVNDKPQPKSEQQLRSALFAESGSVGTIFSPGQFHPGGSGGPNGTVGVEAKFLANPWDYVLAVEGTMVFAGAVVRRLAAGATAAASFPFFVRRSDFGSTAARGEENRGELFLPLWASPALLTEVTHLFSEGRVRLGKKQARTTVDFARAVAELGVDRGITRFHRHALFTRNGKMQFASSLGSVEVKERKPAKLVDERLADQIESFREAAKLDKAPARFISAFAELEEAIFNLSAYDIEGQAQAVLKALGFVESEVALRPNFRDQFKQSKKKELRPLSGLSKEWAWECRDSSPEFEIARALAALHGEGKRGAFRTHLEPVEAKERSAYFEWTKDDTGVVWQAGALADNLAMVLQRRSIDARAPDVRAAHPQLHSHHSAGLQAINSFLNHVTDDDKLEALLRGLSLINWTQRQASPVAAIPVAATSPTISKLPPTLPRAYALLKLLSLPDGRLGGSDEPIHHEPAIVPLLRAGRVGEALTIAERRLRSAGLTPFTAQLYFPDEAGVRLAAALLIPINEAAVSVLAAAVLRPLSARS
jgi:CRISPR-associated protein Csx17